MSLPPDKRLSDGDTATGRLLAGARAATEESEPGRKDRVWRKLSQPPRRRPALWLIPVATALAAVVLFFVLPTRSYLAAQQVGTVAFTAGDVQASSPGGAPTAAQAGQQLANGARLRTGAPGRVWARFQSGGALLLDDSEARFTAKAGATQWLELEQGTVVIATAGHVVVLTGGYQVEATDAVFTVKAASEAVLEVYVERGRVVVRGPSTDQVLVGEASWRSSADARAVVAPREGLALARVLLDAGGTPTEAPLNVDGPSDAEVFIDGISLGLPPVSLLTRVGPHSISGRPVEVKAGAPNRLTLPAVSAYEKARQLTLEGHYPEAVAIYEELSKGSGARAEASLYELGRIRLRYLQDPKGALAAFSAHPLRFPDGALAQEAALSAIEVQLQLTQFQPALEAMEAFLARYPSSERLNDVRFLQAQVLAQRGDCAVALPLFVALLEDPKHGDDSLYLTAYCERTLNKQSDARKHLLRYLERFPRGKHRDEAKAALGKR